MPPLTKQFVPVLPRGVDQRADPSELAPGKLVEAKNVVQPTPGILEKRDGFTPMNRDIGGSDLSDGRDLVSTGDTLALRTNEGIYLRSATQNLWQRQGNSRHAAADAVRFVAPYGYKPSQAVSSDGKYRYSFYGDAGVNTIAQTSELVIGNAGSVFGATSNWYHSVEDMNGIQVVPPTALGIANGWQAIPVVTEDKIWLFVGAEAPGGRYIQVVTFDTTTPGVFTVTDYYDAGTAGSRAIHGFDVRKSPTGAVCVAVAGVDLEVTGGGTFDVALSFLDTATGLPSSVPGVVSATVGTITDQCMVQWLEDENDPNPIAYYLLVSGPGLAKPEVRELALDDLATDSSTTLDGYSSCPQLITGLHMRTDTLGDYFTFASTPGTAPESDFVEGRAHKADNTSVSTFVLKYGLTLASRLFPMGPANDFYLIVVHDDNLAHVQGGYFLIRAAGGGFMDGQIHGRTLFGAGGDAGQRGTFTAGSDNFAWLFPVSVTSDVATAAVNSWDATEYNTARITFELDAPLGPMVVASEGQEVAIPAAWPLQLAGQNLAEYIPQWPTIAPNLSEVSDSIGGGIAPGVYSGLFLFAFRDSAGNISRSAPSPATEITVTGPDTVIQWEVEPLRQVNSGGQFLIELYLTDTDRTVPYLQATIPNDPTQASITYVLQNNVVLTNETLYSHLGAELENDPVGPFRVAGAWRNRLIVSDTDVPGDVWVSKEKEVGKGFVFSADLTFNIADGAERIRAMGAVDNDYFAIFKEDGIWVISGPGPDRLAHGMYEPIRLPGTMGCTDPRSCETTPLGLTFRAVDGRRWLLTRSLQLVDINAGVENFKGRTSGGAVFDPKTQQLREVLRAA